MPIKLDLTNSKQRYLFLNMDKSDHRSGTRYGFFRVAIVLRTNLRFLDTLSGLRGPGPYFYVTVPTAAGAETGGTSSSS